MPITPQQAASAEGSVVKSGHFFAVICDDENDEFWVVQLRHDVDLRVVEPDAELDICWLCEDPRKPGMYRIDYNDKVSLASFACPVNLRYVSHKRYELMESERNKIVHCLDELAKRAEADPNSISDVSLYVLQAPHIFVRPQEEPDVPSSNKGKRKRKAKSTLTKTKTKSAKKSKPVPKGKSPQPKAHAEVQKRSRRLSARLGHGDGEVNATNDENQNPNELPAEVMAMDGESPAMDAAVVANGEPISTEVPLLAELVESPFGSGFNASPAEVQRKRKTRQSSEDGEVKRQTSQQSKEVEPKPQRQQPQDVEPRRQTRQRRQTPVVERKQELEAMETSPERLAVYEGSSVKPDSVHGDDREGDAAMDDEDNDAKNDAEDSESDESDDGDEEAHAEVLRQKQKVQQELLNFGGNTVRASKELIMAVRQEEHARLSFLVADTECVYSLFVTQSVALPHTALYYVCQCVHVIFLCMFFFAWYQHIYFFYFSGNCWK